MAAQNEVTPGAKKYRLPDNRWPAGLV